MMKMIKISLCTTCISVLFLLYGCGQSHKPTPENNVLPVKKDSTVSQSKLPELLVIKGTNVNLRVSPDLKSVRIRQLTTNDTCEIIEKGKQEKIDNTTDFWYKIRFKNKEGWIYGAFTSLKVPEKPVVEESKSWFKK